MTQLIDIEKFRLKDNHEIQSFVDGWNKALDVISGEIERLPIQQSNELNHPIIISGGFQPDGWIDVRERLPENDTFVLVCSPEGKINKAYAQIMSHSAFFVRDGENLIVTHWQPLPNPPITNN